MTLLCRVWDRETKIMSEVRGVYRGEAVLTKDVENFDIFRAASKDRDRYVMLFSTGQKDVTGNLVFHGDILQNVSTPSLSVGVYSLTVQSLIAGMMDLNKSVSIGNVFQNVELLSNARDNTRDTAQRIVDGE